MIFFSSRFRTSLPMDEGNETANSNNSTKEAKAKTPNAIESKNTTKNDYAISKECEEDDTSDERDNYRGYSSPQSRPTLRKGDQYFKRKNSCTAEDNAGILKVSSNDEDVTRSNKERSEMGASDGGGSSINCFSSIEKNECPPSIVKLTKVFTIQIDREDNVSSSDQCVTTNSLDFHTKLVNEQGNRNNKSINSSHKPTIFQNDTAQSTDASLVANVPKAPGYPHYGAEILETNPFKKAENIVSSLQVHRPLALTAYAQFVPVAICAKGEQTYTLSKDERESKLLYRNTANPLGEIGDGKQPSFESSHSLANEDSQLSTADRSLAEKANSLGKNKWGKPHIGDEAAVANEQQLQDLAPIRHKISHEEEKHPGNTTSDIEDGRDVTSEITNHNVKTDTPIFHSQKADLYVQQTQTQVQVLSPVKNQVDQFGNNFNDNITHLLDDAFQQTAGQVTEKASDKNVSQTQTARDAGSEVDGFQDDVTSQDDVQQGHRDRNQDSLHCSTDHENLVLSSERSNEEIESIFSNGDRNEAQTASDRESTRDLAISREVLIGPQYEKESALASEGFDTTPCSTEYDISSRTDQGYDNATTQDAALAGVERLQLGSDSAGNGAHTETESCCIAVQPRTPSPFWATSGENTIPRIVGIYQVLQRTSANSIESSNRHSRRRSERHYAMSPVQAIISLHDIVRDIHEPALLSDGHANRNSHFSFCLVCIQQPVEVVLSCGHIVTCRECARDLPFGCPLCQAPLQYFIPLCLQLME